MKPYNISTGSMVQYLMIIPKETSSFSIPKITLDFTGIFVNFEAG